MAEVSFQHYSEYSSKDEADLSPRYMCKSKKLVTVPSTRCFANAPELHEWNNCRGPNKKHRHSMS